MCECCCGQQVRRARASGCGAEHETLAQPLFGVSRRSKAHALFILATIKRQRILHLVQSLTQASHIAMAENAKAATAHASLFAVDLNILVFQPFDDGLGGCQRQRFGRHIGGDPLSDLAVPPFRILNRRESHDTNFATGCNRIFKKGEGAA